MLTIGRTGRAGHKGKAVTFFTEQDTPNLRSIAAVMKESGCNVPDYMLVMKKHSKKEKRELVRKAPAREKISTLSRFKRVHNNKTSRKSVTNKSAEKVNGAVGKTHSAGRKTTKKRKTTA